MIGQGGFGAVYAVWDAKLQREVAVKALRHDLMPSPSLLGRFQQEARAVARLRHPNILPVHFVGEGEGIAFMVMPKVEGENVRTALDQEGQLSVDEALRITSEAARGLQIAHDAGIIHRDVKPENILLEGTDRRVLLMDFGIAKATAGAGTAITATGMLVGTPLYMSPEQASGDRDVDHRSDIYALGCVLYEMLSGDPPHLGTTAQAIMAKALMEKPTRLSLLRDTVPAHVEEAVDIALAKAPSDRFQSANDFAGALQGTARVLSGSTAAAPTSDAPSKIRTRKALAAAILVFATVGILLVTFLRPGAVPLETVLEIERLAEQGRWEAAYAVTSQAEDRAPRDTVLDRLWPLFSYRMSFATEPAGATVYRKQYNAPEDAWEVLGVTPLDSIRYPLGLSLLRFELEGYRTAHASVAHWFPLETLELQPVDELPENKVWIPGGTFGVLGYQLGPYVLDRYEVTNRQYKDFVDSGGYSTPDYWTDPIIANGRELTWAEAMALMVDRTGRHGPSNWEIGDYPIGQDDYPVTGVSWYEARAYARFVGRDLPTFHHWRNASRSFNAPWLLPKSNIDGEALAAVGHHRGVSRYGCLDLAGNAREWVFNAADEGTRYILGGGWDDAAYTFLNSNPATGEPLNRSSSNGFRLVTYLDSVNLDLAKRPVPRREYPDYRRLQPVSDEVFEVYRNLYEFDRLSLAPVVDAVDTSRHWIRERVSFNVAYMDDPAVVYVYLPKTGQRPLQSVVYWPGGNALRLDHIDQYRGFNIDFVVRSGRALLFPVYTGTFERRLNALPDRGSNAYEAMVIEWIRQTRSAVDLVHQRYDLEDTKVAFYGWSWGGKMGPVALALEPRFVTGILEVAGLRDDGQTPAVDPFNFVSRVTHPVLMLNGRFDTSYPYDVSALPLYELLGTDPEHKLLVAGETDGHNLPRDEVIRETLAWLDRYVGPVAR
jgi:hypothetical protein